MNKIDDVVFQLKRINRNLEDMNKTLVVLKDYIGQTTVFLESLLNYIYKND